MGAKPGGFVTVPARRPVDDALDRLTETRRNVAASLIAVKGLFGRS